MGYALALDVTAVDTEHGIVLLDQSAGRYWQINGTGATVLRSILRHGAVDPAVEILRERHGDSAARIATDAQRLLDKLIAAKLVTS